MRKRETRTGAALAASVFLVLFYGIVIYNSMGFIYAIADDIIMRDIASGAFTGTPDGHLIFVRYLLGFLLSCCYQMNAAVDWYGFFMAGVILLGLAAVLYRGFSEEKTLVWKTVYAGIALGVFGCAMIFHIAQFEWTVSAAMTGASALYLYVTSDDSGKGKKFLEGIIIWLLLFLTYGIRTNVFLMVLPGFGIAFLWKCFRRNGRGFYVSWKEIILPAVVFLTVGFIMLTEHLAYRGEEWKEFQDFQSARSDIYDYYGVPSYEENPELFEEMGLSEEEIRNLRHYALYLVDGMDAELMEQVAAEAERQSGKDIGFGAKLKAGIHLAVEQMTDSRYFSVSIPLLLFLAGDLFLAFWYDRRAFCPLLLFLVAEGVLWLYLGFMGRLPERVAFSMHLITLLGVSAVFFCLWKQKKEENESWKTPVILILAGCFLGVSAFQWKSSVAANEEKLAMDSSYQEFKLSCKENPENLYFIETFMAEPVGGAHVSTQYSAQINNCLTLGDWYTTSPLDKERFEQLGIDSVEETILYNPNAYLVVRDIDAPGFLADYFEEKYSGVSLVCTETENVGGRDYYLYQVQWE